MTPGGVSVAHGIDVVEVARIAQTLERHGERFVARVFTPSEAAYAAGSKRRDEHLAARFAAKEALFKAIGTGWAQGVDWKDAEVVREASGRPGILLRGRAAEVAQALRIDGWLLSLSHAGGLACASVIGIRHNT